MQRETKSAKILELDARGDFTTQEIADAVGCLDSYVRTVRARKRGGGQSVADHNYNAKIERAGGHAAAREAQRNEYRRLRNAGFSKLSANRIANRIKTRVACASLKSRSDANA